MPVSSHHDQDFINSLTKIVEANLSNEKFDVKELAATFGMSHSQIHRKLKLITNKTTSQFIREYRLEHSKKMLQDEGKTISEIAYEVGFGSPSYFNKCFHDYFGFSPGEARKLYVIDKKSGNQEVSELLDTKKKKRVYIKKWILVAASIMGMVLVSYVIYESLISKSVAGKFDKGVEKSIIVLPFKNLSDEENNQYFADGICEDILKNLTQISAFKVLSRTSSEQFGESTLSSAEIARKMKVNYLLEGSVRKHVMFVLVFS